MPTKKKPQKATFVSAYGERDVKVIVKFKSGADIFVLEMSEDEAEDFQYAIENAVDDARYGHQ